MNGEIKINEIQAETLELERVHQLLKTVNSTLPPIESKAQEYAQLTDEFNNCNSPDEINKVWLKAYQQLGIGQASTKL